MARIKIICPGCGRSLRGDERHRGKKVECPHCKHLILVPLIAVARTTSKNRRHRKRRFSNFILTVACLLVLMAVIAVIGFWFIAPAIVHWPDRRPIGVLFLASNSSASPTNPRGWFNDPGLDFTGTNGSQRFRRALLDYTDHSIAILKRTGAQGAIVWDLEGEQFPHKTTFIGDPRLLDRLAPEMATVADEFFGRLRSAGLKVGLTVRPQRLVFDASGQPRQTQVFDTQQILLEKIDFARTRWGATLFYIDSNGGIRRPDEVWQLRHLAEQRPDILLIPEHHYLPYWAFSAPYASLRKGEPVITARWARKIYPRSFQALDVSDAASDAAKITTAWLQGDVLLFRAWFWSPECDLLEGLAHTKQ